MRNTLNCKAELTMAAENGRQCAYKLQNLVEPQNNLDIEMAICKVKIGKATGHDQIPAELIKHGGKELKKVIYELIPKVLEEEIIPHEKICHNMSTSSERGHDDM